MSKDDLLSCIEKMDEIAAWSRGTVEIGVTVVNDDYYVDLGAFGEQSMYVEASDDYHSIDVDEVMDKAPYDLGEIIDTLREVADSMSGETPTLDGLLAEMAASGTGEEKQLALVLMAVADAMRHFPTTAAVGAPPIYIPEKGPAPWPGALREDIDYTADDFPLRFQPPPGWSWSHSSIAVTPEKAEKKSCRDLRDHPGVGNMVLDAKGRCSWLKRGDDALEDENGRWMIWFHGTNGFRSGSGDFSGHTEPLAISEDGEVLGDWTGSSGRTGKNAAWRTDSDATYSISRAREIRAEYYDHDGAESPPAEKPPVEGEFDAPEPVEIPF